MSDSEPQTERVLDNPTNQGGDVVAVTSGSTMPQHTHNRDEWSSAASQDHGPSSSTDASIPLQPMAVCDLLVPTQFILCEIVAICSVSKRMLII